MFAIILVVRHTRAEEETGRLELLGATVLGRLAPLTAALVVAADTNVVLGGLAAFGMMASGLPADGSFAFSLAWTGVGLAFTAIAAVVAQLTRTARAATGIGVVVVGIVYVLRAVGDTVDVTGPSWLTLLSPIGWALDAYLTAMLAMVGIAASAYGIQAAMRLRAEENALHTEQLLATAVERIRWAAGHIAIAILGTTVLMAAMRLSTGVAHAAQMGDVRPVGRVLGGALVRLPAAWVLIGIVVTAFGFAPRLIAAGWAALVGFLLLAEIGPMLKLDSRVMDLSPYAHVPKLPGARSP